MNIPASYLFSEKKFESFKDYLELSAIQDDWQYDIVNDIGYKGKIFEDATLQKGGIPTESKDLASCDLIVQMNKSFNKVYLPGVRYVQFSTVFKPLNIGEIYIQPNSSVKAMTLSAYGGSIDVKSLHMQAVPRILISNIVVEELHLQSKERTLTYLRCSKGGEYYNISKISADSKVIVYQKGNNTILAQDINDRISKESIEKMTNITHGSWEIYCRQGAQVFIQNGQLRVNGTKLKIKEIPDDMWLVMREAFGRVG